MATTAAFLRQTGWFYSDQVALISLAATDKHSPDKRVAVLVDVKTGPQRAG